MTIEAVAKQFKLRLKKDDCGDEIIPGKLGHLYMFNEEEDLVGAMFIPDEPQKGWSKRRKELVAAGGTVVQDGDLEGAVTFPADCAKGIRLAIKLLKIYRKRTISKEQSKALSERLKKARAAKTAKQT